MYIIKSLLLFSKDSYIPVSRKDSLTKLFIALNHNNIILRHPLYDTLKDLTNYLTVVLSCVAIAKTIIQNQNNIIK